MISPTNSTLAPAPTLSQGQLGCQSYDHIWVYCMVIWPYMGIINPCYLSFSSQPYLYNPSLSWNSSLNGEQHT